MARTLVGTRIREGRRAKGFTQSALASHVGISASYLNLIEHNRRGIAGKTLAALAEALELPMRDLAEGADQTLLDRLKEAAQSEPAVKSELLKLEELVGRFPGWARLIKRLQDRIDAHSDELTALSDQLNRDPFFSEAMHLMLSNITALRSTVEILTGSEDVPDDAAQRFMENLQFQVVRLSEIAQELQMHFETQSRSIASNEDSAPNETFWEARAFFDFNIESGASIPDVTDPKLTRDLELYSKVATQISASEIQILAPKYGFDPLAIATETKTALPMVFRRLAHLPHSEGFPEFGLMVCDQSGGVLFRKPLPQLALPRRSGGCPLWPIYRASQRPDQPICARMVMPSGEEVLTFSVAHFDGPVEFDLPPRMMLSMLYTPQNPTVLPNIDHSRLPLIEVGAQCSICPRTACPARRDAFILG
ncbi:MAG: short-chain fatty acyl-CoA regulator family protein [Pseudomonadota bacterium]